MENFKPPRRARDEQCLAVIRRQPCLICGNDVSVEAHHPRIGVVGMARKADDHAAVPLCGRHHRELHTMNEREFWASYGITRR
jgi:hypothetical protein